MVNETTYTGENITGNVQIGSTWYVCTCLQSGQANCMIHKNQNANFWWTYTFTNPLPPVEKKAHLCPVCSGMGKVPYYIDEGGNLTSGLGYLWKCHAGCENGVLWR
jgi:hypothetical protein